MDSTRYELVRNIFLAARDLVGREREDLLRERCGDDAELRGQVDEYLLGDERKTDFLEQPVLAPSAPLELAEKLVGSAIGPYTILSVIGEGGFGVVYLAERREPHVQQVALKVIKPGMDSRSVLARFNQERQALAVMDHVNIAKVFDAGATDDGLPYFVMELVRGEPITTYCDQERLGTHARLEVFALVCEAIQHAHSKGIIHRDVKPSNVLVAVQDGRPIPKVIDFGIAKAVTSPLTDQSIFTDQGQLVGTPEYMSPEQAEMGAVDIDTRTDVYSLGVLLYELLTGAPPFEAKALRRAGFDEIRRIIREVDPPRPSTKLSSMGDAAVSIAEYRQMRLEDLTGQLRHELEWVPLRALRKDRSERYETPLDMAKDIRRYLAGEPLEAGPDSATYRFKKLVRRNRKRFAAAVVVLFVLVIGIIGTTTGWFAAEQRTREAEDARRQAALVNDAHAWIAGATSPVETYSVLDVLNIQLRILEHAPPSDPVLEAAVREFLAEQAASLGMREIAIRESQNAHRLLELNLGASSSQTLDAARNAAKIACLLDNSDENLRSFLAIVLNHREQLGDDHPQTWAAIQDYAIALHNKSAAVVGAARAARREALQMLQIVQDSQRDHADARSLAVGRTHNALAGYMENLEQDNASARDHARRALQIFEAQLGEYHWETLTVRERYAVIAIDRELLLRILDDKRAYLPPMHAALGTTINNVVTFCRDLLSVEQRGALIREEIEILQKHDGNCDSITLWALWDLAEWFLEQGQLDNAIDEFWTIHEVSRACPRSEDAARLSIARRFTEVLLDARRYEEAVRASARIIEIAHRGTVGARRIAQGYRQNVSALIALGRYEDAIAVADDLLERSQPLILVLDEKGRINGADNIAGRYLIMAMARIAAGQFDEAQIALDEGKTWFDLAPREADRVKMIEVYAGLYEKMHKLRPNAGYGTQARAWRGLLPVPAGKL